MYRKRIEEVQYSTQTERPFNKSIAFTEAFNDFVSQEENEGIMFEVKKCIDEIKDDNDTLQPGQIFETERTIIEFIGKGDRVAQSTDYPRKYFRVKTKKGDGDFFVKVNPNIIHKHEQGASEVLEMQQLKKEMEDFNSLGEFKVRVPEYCLGYKDSHSTYYVSKFEEIMRENLDDYFQRILNKPGIPLEEKKIALELVRRVMRLRTYEADKNLGHKDFGGNNMAYDREKDEIILFDVR